MKLCIKLVTYQNYTKIHCQKNIKSIVAVYKLVKRAYIQPQTLRAGLHEASREARQVNK